LDLTEDTIGIWYVEGNDKNWLLTLFHEDGVVKGKYRFRYYKDDDAFNSDDEKSWYNMTSPDSEKRTIDTIRTVTLMTSIQFKGSITEILRGDKSFDDFVADLMKQDFVHIVMKPIK